MTGWRSLGPMLAVGLSVLTGAHAVSDDQPVRIRQEKQGNVVRLYADAVNCRDATITVEADLTNMRAEPALPTTVEMRDGRTVELGVLRPLAPGTWNYRYRYHCLVGASDGEPDDTLYQLPFAGSSRRLSQGFQGKFSHQAGTNNEFALDWTMPIGTPVLAARGGVVVAVRQDSTEGGTRDEHKRAANYIVVRHADGTYGEYLHLQAQGARVRLGETVATGQLLGLSGNTGYSTLPHLHFAVFRTIDGQRRETLPVKFQDRRGRPLTLREGQLY